MPKKPQHEPGTVSLAEMAEFLRLTERRVQQLAKENITVPGKAVGRYKLVESAYNYIGFAVKSSNKDPELERFVREEKEHKAQIAKHNANRRAREEQAELGILIDREKTIQIWRDHLTKVQRSCRRWLTAMQVSVTDLPAELRNKQDTAFLQFFESINADVPASLEPVKKTTRKKKAKKVAGAITRSVQKKKKIRTKQGLAAAAKARARAKRSTHK